MLLRRGGAKRGLLSTCARMLAATRAASAEDIKTGACLHKMAAALSGSTVSSLREREREREGEGERASGSKYIVV